MNGLTQPLYAYNGSFSQADSLQPYAGYYFENREDSANLVVPYSFAFNGGTTVAAAAVPVYDWKVDAVISNEAGADSLLSFGVAKSAKKAMNALDYRKPRATGEVLSAYFNHTEWSADSHFATDIRPELTDLETWAVEVNDPAHNSAQPTQVKFKGIDQIPTGYEVYLVDSVLSKSQNLRTNPVYAFNPVKPISSLKVMVGTAASVQKQLEAMMPKAYRLGQNYPNPFNPTTMIPITLPVRANVDLKIYNLLGQVVKVLHTGQLEAGNHFIEWNAKGVASGVYICRMTTDGAGSYWVKMVLIK